MDFGVSVNHRLKIKESEFLHFVREIKKTGEHEGDEDTTCAFGTTEKKIWKNIDGIWDERKNRVHQDVSIIKWWWKPKGVCSLTDSNKGLLVKTAVKQLQTSDIIIILCHAY